MAALPSLFLRDTGTGIHKTPTMLQVTCCDHSKPLSLRTNDSGRSFERGKTLTQQHGNGPLSLFSYFLHFRRFIDWSPIYSSTRHFHYSVPGMKDLNIWIWIWYGRSDTHRQFAIQNFDHCVQVLLVTGKKWPKTRVRKIYGEKSVRAAPQTRHSYFQSHLACTRTSNKYQKICGNSLSPDQDILILA